MKRRRKRPGGYRRRGPVPAGASLGRVLDRYGVARELREHRLLSQWQRVVGPSVAARSQPSGLERGVLWVKVEHPAWLHELSFMAADIAAKANEICGTELVKSVRFHVGSRRSRADDPLAPTLRIRRAPAGDRPLPAPASGESLQRIEAETEGIEDEELRDLIRSARKRLNL